MPGLRLIQVIALIMATSLYDMMALPIMGSKDFSPSKWRIARINGSLPILAKDYDIQFTTRYSDRSYDYKSSSTIHQGLEQFEKNKYPSAISHLERAITMYPKPIGRFHVLLGQMYLANGEIEKAKDHALKAQNINPEHEAPTTLLGKINLIERE